MSQRKPETIVINVPKEWDDKDKEDFRILMVESTSHSRWENTTIFITNKMDVKLVSTDVMDKLRSSK